VTGGAAVTVGAGRRGGGAETVPLDFVGGFDCGAAAGGVEVRVELIAGSSALEELGPLAGAALGEVDGSFIRPFPGAAAPVVAGLAGASSSLVSLRFAVAVKFRSARRAALPGPEFDDGR
jgi:hypothetical protein